MNKWKSAAMGGLSVSLAAGLVVGCGSSSPAVGNGNGNALDANVPKGITLTIWSWKSGPEFKDVKKIADDWAQKHGDKVVVVDQSNNPNHFDIYGTDARTGKGPDIGFAMPHDNNGLLSQEGLVAEVPDGMYNSTDYTQSVTDAVTINGKIYSLPISVETTALFYNKNLVKTAPADWNSFAQTATSSGFMFDIANLYTDFAFIGGSGGYVFKNNNGTLDPNDIGLNNAGAVSGYSLLHDMNAKYHWMTGSATGDIAKAKFTAGKLGMYISGPWDIPDVKKSGVPFGIATLPTLPNGQAATPFMGVQTVIVNAKSKNQAAAWSLVQALTSKDAQTQYFNDGQQIPALLPVEQSSAVQNDEYFKAFSDQIKNAVPMPNIRQMQAVWGAMKVIKNIVDGTVTPQKGADDFVKNIKSGIQVQGS